MTGTDQALIRFTGRILCLVSMLSVAGCQWELGRPAGGLSQTTPLATLKTYLNASDNFQFATMYECWDPGQRAWCLTTFVAVKRYVHKVESVSQLIDSRLGDQDAAAFRKDALSIIYAQPPAGLFPQLVDVNQVKLAMQEDKAELRFKGEPLTLVGIRHGNKWYVRVPDNAVQTAAELAHGLDTMEAEVDHIATRVRKGDLKKGDLCKGSATPTSFPDPTPIVTNPDERSAAP